MTLLQKHWMEKRVKEMYEIFDKSFNSTKPKIQIMIENDLGLITQELMEYIEEKGKETFGKYYEYLFSIDKSGYVIEDKNQIFTEF